MQDLLTAALEMHHMGYTMIGSGGAKGNNPSVSGRDWQHTKHDTNELVEAISQPRVRGIGAITTGIAVIDLDRKNDVDGVAVFNEWLHEHDPGFLMGLSSHMSADTPTGGVHYYFKDPDHQVTNSGGSLRNLRGVDVRGVGGFIAQPPTQRAGTAGYVWRVGPVPVDELSPAPDWLKGGMNLSTHDGWSPDDTNWGTDQLAAAARAVSTCIPGTRNDTLHLQARAMGHLICEGNLSVRSVQRVLLLGATDAGLDQYEASATIRSGLVWVLTQRGETLTQMANEL